MDDIFIGKRGNKAFNFVSILDYRHIILIKLLCNDFFLSLCVYIWTKKHLEIEFIVNKHIENVDLISGEWMFELGKIFGDAWNSGNSNNGSVLSE